MAWWLIMVIVVTSDQSMVRNFGNSPGSLDFGEHFASGKPGEAGILARLSKGSHCGASDRSWTIMVTM